jgi:hypothetical protein
LEERNGQRREELLEEEIKYHTRNEGKTKVFDQDIGLESLKLEEKDSLSKSNSRDVGDIGKECWDSLDFSLHC